MSDYAGTCCQQPLLMARYLERAENNGLIKTGFRRSLSKADNILMSGRLFYLDGCQKSMMRARVFDQAQATNFYFAKN